MQCSAAAPRGLTLRSSRRATACGLRTRLSSNVRPLSMQICPSCRAPVSVGASDCAVCGHVLASLGEARTFSQPVVLFLLGVVAALWVGITSVFLLWVYPLLLLASLVAGLVIVRRTPRESPRALLLLVLPFCASTLWLWRAASVVQDFGTAMLQVGLAQTVFLLLPVLVVSHHRP